MQRCADVFHCYLVLADGTAADLTVVDKILADQASRSDWPSPEFVEQTGSTRHFLGCDMRMRASIVDAAQGAQELHIAIAGEGTADEIMLQTRLAATVYELLEQIEVSELRWLDGVQPISPADFRALLAPATDAASPTTPVRARRPRLPSIRRHARPARLVPAGPDARGANIAPARPSLLSLQQKLLRDAMRFELSPAALIEEFGPQRDSDPLRLSAWLFTFVVALLALPVAVLLAVYNLARGENFRVATQVMVLASVLSMPQVAAALPFDPTPSGLTQIVAALESAVPLISRII